MFRKKSNHTKITCNSQVLSDIMSTCTISSISVSEEVDISSRRKEYTLVEISAIDDRITAGIEYDASEMQRLLMRDIKSCDGMLILTMQYTNNNIRDINLIGRVFKVNVIVEELKLKVRLFINK